VPPSRCIVLDVDGTLVDSNYLHVVAWQAAFADQGRHIAAWEIHRAVGMGADRLVPALVGHAAAEEIGAVVSADHDERFRQVIADVKPIAGARELLSALKRRGLTVVLGSSAAAEEVDHYLGLLEARELVDHVTTAADVDRTKPDPSLIESAIGRAGVPALAMIGDTVWDCRAAAALDLRALALLCGGISEGELRGGGAHSVYRDPTELVPQLETVLK
jgi:phosphoglycolate phosphatase-like HAD superfamily hydrolase